MIRVTHQLDKEEFYRLADGSEAHTMWERAERLHNRFFTITLDLPHRSRSTGPKKQKPDDPGYQSNHLNGHLSQLAKYYGYTKTEMKLIMKDDVPDWPMEERKIGKRVKLRPVSEADISMELCSQAIEWTHLIAAEEGIVLKEE